MLFKSLFLILSYECVPVTRLVEPVLVIDTGFARLDFAYLAHPRCLQVHLDSGPCLIPSSFSTLYCCDLSGELSITPDKTSFWCVTDTANAASLPSWWLVEVMRFGHPFLWRNLAWDSPLFLGSAASDAGCEAQSTHST